MVVKLIIGQRHWRATSKLHQFPALTHKYKQGIREKASTELFWPNKLKIKMRVEQHRMVPFRRVEIVFRFRNQCHDQGREPPASTNNRAKHFISIFIGLLVLLPSPLSLSLIFSCFGRLTRTLFADDGHENISCQQRS